jgi:penicillin-binding protein 1B
LLADAGCADAQALPFLRGSAPQQYAPCANAAQSSSPLNWFEKLFKK